MSQKIIKDDIIKVAKLAKLQLSDSELEKFFIEIKEILEYVNILDNLKIANLEPTNQVTGLVNVWRDDEIIDYGYQPVELLSNVPDQENGYIKVNRVI